MASAAKHLDPIVGLDMHRVQPPPPAPPVMMPIPVADDRPTLSVDPPTSDPNVSRTLPEGTDRTLTVERRGESFRAMCPHHGLVGKLDGSRLTRATGCYIERQSQQTIIAGVESAIVEKVNSDADQSVGGSGIIEMEQCALGIPTKFCADCAKQV